jgi:tetratricopeptide (TPR) repeat protein
VASVLVTPPGAFSLTLESHIGWGLVPYQGLLGSTVFGSLAAEASFRLGSAVSVGLRAGYAYQYSVADLRTFAHGPVAGLGLRYFLGAATYSRLKVLGTTFDPVFPVFHAYYDEHPFGSVRLQNAESGVIKNIKVSLFVPGYMSQPKLSRTIAQLGPSEQVEVPIVALFTPSILAITDTTKVGAELRLEYDYLDATKKDTTGITLVVHHRNAMTWDDDRKAAAFVTPTDPGILRFSKAVASAVRSEPPPAINTVFRQAVGLFEAIRAQGVRYVTDPTTPYAETSQNRFTIDYLQFPSQTLAYGAGDCDDLSILYSALLESVGIPSALVTIPGHIYVAVGLSLTEEEARRLFTNAADLDFDGGQAWMPIEVTLVEQGFNAAWHAGAREWHQQDGAGVAPLLKVRDAWKEYHSVEFADQQFSVKDADVATTMKRYGGELARFVEDQIGEKAAGLRDRIAAGTDTARYRNQLGVLYAQYGRYDEAAVELGKAAAAGLLAARANLGNVQALQKEFAAAAETYRAVLAVSPNNVGALVGFAKANRELENYGVVRTTYEKLRAADPTIAEQFAYLVGDRATGEEDDGRAASAAREEAVVWEGDQELD